MPSPKGEGCESHSMHYSLYTAQALRSCAYWRLFGKDPTARSHRVEQFAMAPKACQITQKQLEALVKLHVSDLPEAVITSCNPDKVARKTLALLI